MSKIVISFGNSREPVLGLIDLSTGEQSYQALSLQNVKGIAGLTVSDGNICAAVQTDPSQSLFVVFDALSFQTRSTQDLNVAQVSDVHSIYKGYNKIYMVSTGTDELVTFQFDGLKISNPNITWRPDPNLPRGDFHHLTSVWERAGVIYVGVFGRKTDIEEIHWSSALNGFIYNVTAQEQAASGIQHPHSGILVDTMLAYCESLTGTLHFPDNEVSVGSYPRGLCATGSSIFVGNSVGRDGTGNCKVIQLRMEDLSVEREYVFGEHGNEIYDLVHIPD